MSFCFCCKTTIGEESEEEEDEEDKLIDISKLTCEQRDEVANKEFARRMKEQDDVPLSVGMGMVEAAWTHYKGTLDRMREVKNLVSQAKKKKRMQTLGAEEDEEDDEEEGGGKKVTKADFSMQEMLEIDKALAGIKSRLQFADSKLTEAADAVRVDVEEIANKEHDMCIGVCDLMDVLESFKQFESLKEQADLIGKEKERRLMSKIATTDIRKQEIEIE